ncbi:MAG: B12-binding domain-containing radical SAM protein [Desulfobacterales bacterium]|nr:B12-binding domain-containing radical SAM protein [Desulfobacterales bacterium]
MKVLLISPKTPRSFWTFEQSMEMVDRKVLLPPLGLITVAALLPADWELRFVDRNFQLLGDDQWNWAEMVMVSGMFAQKEDMLGLIRESKNRGLPVVAGGPYVTSVPDEAVQAGADFVLRGEAETMLAGWLEALAAGATEGVFAESEKPDMATVPIPRYDLLDLRAYSCMPVQTSRGCPFNCEFCDIINLYGRVPRYKKPEQVIAELETLYQLGWNGGVFICDDNFIGNKKHARAILAQLTPWMESHGKPFGFWTQASVNLGQDLEMIDLMTEANFGYIFIGIESPDESVLTATRKHQNVNNPLVESLHAINANGLSVMGSFILGFDEETKGAGERICAFVEKTRLPLIMLNCLEAAPNTALWDRLQQENRLLKDRTEGTGGSGTLNFIPSRPEAEIIAEYLEGLDVLYEPSKFMKRAYNYYLAMRPTRRALARSRGEKVQPPMVLKDKRPANRVIRDRRIRPALRLIWRQGMVSPHRVQFWKQLAGIYLKNPSRITTYLITLALGENMFQHREIVKKRVTARLAVESDQRSIAFPGRGD